MFARATLSVCSGFDLVMLKQRGVTERSHVVISKEMTSNHTVLKKISHQQWQSICVQNQSLVIDSSHDLPFYFRVAAVEAILL